VNTSRGVALAAALATFAVEALAQAQDSAPHVRHILAIDYSRIKPFRRSFDVFVAWADSVVPMGRRDVSLEEVSADSAAGWLLVETRAGSVNSVDSIFLAPDLRPVRWHSTLGGATLEMAFTSDSLRANIRMGPAGTHASAAIPPDLIVSAAAFEMLAPLLPLTESWSDTASALTVTLSGTTVESVDLAVFGTDSVAVAPDLPPRASWVLAMRAGRQEARLWVDRETGDVLRAQQLLPSHVGAVLEYRMRLQLTTAP
jgi:hypothetical protein